MNLKQNDGNLNINIDKIQFLKTFPTSEPNRNTYTHFLQHYIDKIRNRREVTAITDYSERVPQGSILGPLP